MEIDRRQFVIQTTVAGLALAARNVAGAPRSVTVAAAGDCIITRAIHDGADADCRALLRLFQSADIGFGNCEMTFHDLVGEGYPAPTGACGDLNLVADPAIVKDLARSGFNLMTVANNHGGDYGHAGLLATIRNLRAAGIAVAGGGGNIAQAREPAFRSTGHGRVALVACASTFREGSQASPSNAEIPGRPGISTLRVQTVYDLPRDQIAELRRIGSRLGRAPDGAAPATRPATLQVFGSTFREAPAPAVTTEADPGDINAITAEVARARAEADLVLVTIHAHENGASREEPAAFLQPFARACIDAGADVFLGHGPHVLRGIELYKGRPIFYSLGNFFFEAETIEQIPEEIYENCGIGSLSPSNFFHKVMGRMFEQDVFWEAIVPRLSFESGRLTEAILYPVDLRRHDPPTQRGVPALARGPVAAGILQRQAALAREFGTSLEIGTDGTARIKLSQS